MAHELAIRWLGAEVRQTRTVLALVERQVKQRCPAMVVGAPEGVELTLTLGLDAGIEGGGFSIAGPAEAITILGEDVPGLLAGVGKFLRTSSYRAEGLTPSVWRGVSRPSCALRGIYFASHFHNWYHEAGADELAHYIEDLALWGVNAILVAFPFIDLQDWDDPAAGSAVQQVRRLLSTARGLGLRVGLNCAPNSQFLATPAHLRATPLPDPLGRRGNHGVSVCPNVPGGLDLILDNYRRLFERLQIDLDVLCLWPYDEGGCACPRCLPWGANGFLSCSRALAALGREFFPQLHVILSTWMFDTPPEGEWEGLTRVLARGNDWVNGIMADAHEDYPRYPLERGVPGDLPLLNFPEISMWGLFPWGGFGASPLPARLQRLWNQVKPALAGGFAYSEGLFEDANKAVVAQFYWDRECTAEDTLREYIAYECAPQAVDDVLRMIGLVEHTQTRAATERYVDLASAEEAYALACQVDATLPAWARTGWRWRLLYLRALLDVERYRTAGEGPLPAGAPQGGWGALLRGNARAQEAMRELVALYHAQLSGARSPHTWVRPPLAEE